MSQGRKRPPEPTLWVETTEFYRHIPQVQPDATPAEAKAGDGHRTGKASNQEWKRCTSRAPRGCWWPAPTRSSPAPP